jgi:transcriptional regulator with XRE-family HTH domain
MEELFGAFLHEKRTNKKITLRGLSEQVDISPEYLSKIEHGWRAAPTDEVLDAMAVVLQLSNEEKEIFYDLAAQSKRYPALALDLIMYINENEDVHKALRVAKRSGATKEDWQGFIDFLSKKYS